MRESEGRGDVISAGSLTGWGKSWWWEEKRGFHQGLIKVVPTGVVLGLVSPRPLRLERRRSDSSLVGALALPSPPSSSLHKGGGGVCGSVCAFGEGHNSGKQREGD